MGLWLVSSDAPASAPIQVTSAPLDLPDIGAGPTFYDWAYNSGTRERSHMLPRFFAYGSGGHIFGVSLTQPSGAQQLSSGTYALLCSAVAVQAGPFSSAKSYVVAQVALSSASGPCDTTWIIPTDAGSDTTPITPAQPVSFIAGLKDPSTGLATGFLMSSDSELDVYSPASMTKSAALIPSLPAGARVSLISFMSYLSSVQGVVVETGTAGVTSMQDLVYLVKQNNATLVGSYTLPALGACAVGSQNSFVRGAVLDSTLLYVVPDSSGSPGFAVHSVPLTGGTPTTIYSDSSTCDAFVNSASDGRLVLDELSQSISLSATGPSGQTPVTLLTSDGVNNAAFVNYTIGSNAWVVDYALDPVSGVITDSTARIVDLSNGHALKTYAHSTIVGDFWNGFGVDGNVTRGPLFIATGTTSPSCRLSITSIDAVDPSSFASTTTSVSGSHCERTTFGPAPLALGTFSDGLYYISKPANGTLSFGKVRLTAPGGSGLQEVFGALTY